MVNTSISISKYQPDQTISKYNSIETPRTKGKYVLCPNNEQNFQWSRIGH